MKTSGKIFFGIIIFIIAAALVGSLYYGDQKEVEVFGEFSAEVPSGSFETGFKLAEHCIRIERNIRFYSIPSSNNSLTQDGL